MLQWGMNWPNFLYRVWFRSSWLQLVSHRTLRYTKSWITIRIILSLSLVWCWKGWSKSSKTVVLNQHILQRNTCSKRFQMLSQWLLAPKTLPNLWQPFKITPNQTLRFQCITGVAYCTRFQRILNSQVSTSTLHGSYGGVEIWPRVLSHTKTSSLLTLQHVNNEMYCTIGRISWPRCTNATVKSRDEICDPIRRDWKYRRHFHMLNWLWTRFDRKRGRKERAGTVNWKFKPLFACSDSLKRWKRTSWIIKRRYHRSLCTWDLNRQRWWLC